MQAPALKARPMRHAIAVIGVLGIVQAAPAGAVVLLPNADPVLYWNQVANNVIYGDFGLATRSYAMLNVAVHSAVNATVGSPDRSYVGNVSNRGGDTRAAAAVAAHDVLLELHRENSMAIDSALAASLAYIPDSAAKTRGIETGRAYAAATIALRANDGFNDPPPPYVPTGEPGNYVPTSPPNPAINGQFATATPFVMTSPSQFRVGPPPALDSAEYAASFNKVKAIGEFFSTTRTPDQTYSARYWELVLQSPFISGAIEQSLAEGKSIIENARIFATMSMAAADAEIAVFDTKYHYDFWRPVTAIREADTDGNPLTIADPDWEPLLLTPYFPGYYSAHSVIAGATAGVLNLAYDDPMGFCFTTNAGARCWNSFDAAAIDDATSREWGGVHFDFEDEIGLATGYRIGAFVFNQNLFGPVPEPATWAKMVGGFGAIGFIIRRRGRTERIA
jgi:hypothetical protein